MLFGYSKGGLVQDVACHTTSLYHSFSCRYSMSYDISISLLKKTFIKQLEEKL
jgi:hypothetical protein